MTCAPSPAVPAEWREASGMPEQLQELDRIWLQAMQPELNNGGSTRGEQVF